MTEVEGLHFPPCRTPCNVAANMPPHATMQKANDSNARIPGLPHWCPALCVSPHPSTDTPFGRRAEGTKGAPDKTQGRCQHSAMSQEE